MSRIRNVVGRTVCIYNGNTQNFYKDSETVSGFQIEQPNQTTAGRA